VASGGDMLNFSNSTNTWDMQMLGRKDGKAAVELGDGVIFELFDDWTGDQNLQFQFPNFMTFVKDEFPSIFD
jgi:hypothetical protein